MPTYEYICDHCGYVYEKFHKISDDPLKKCPKCNKDSLKRGIGGGGATLRFKGTGFYITDYTKNGSKEKSEPKEEKG